MSSVQLVHLKKRFSVGPCFMKLEVVCTCETRDGIMHVGGSWGEAQLSNEHCTI